MHLGQVRVDQLTAVTIRVAVTTHKWSITAKIVLIVLHYRFQSRGESAEAAFFVIIQVKFGIGISTSQLSHNSLQDSDVRSIYVLEIRQHSTFVDFFLQHQPTEFS